MPSAVAEGHWRGSQETWELLRLGHWPLTDLSPPLGPVPSSTWAWVSALPSRGFRGMDCSHHCMGSASVVPERTAPPSTTNNCRQYASTNLQSYVNRSPEWSKIPSTLMHKTGWLVWLVLSIIQGSLDKPNIISPDKWTAIHVSHLQQNWMARKMNSATVHNPGKKYLQFNGTVNAFTAVWP